MKGVCGFENPTKFIESLPGVQSRLFKNQGTRFILHASFFILHYTIYTLSLLIIIASPASTGY
jgi:hypothetical protein